MQIATSAATYLSSMYLVINNTRLSTIYETTDAANNVLTPINSNYEPLLRESPSRQQENEKSETRDLNKAIKHFNESPRGKQNGVNVKNSSLKTFNYVLIHYENLALAYYIISALKYLLLSSLDLEAMSSYRWLDCYILGRPTISARTTDSIRYIACAVAIYHIVWRLYALIYKPRASYENLEFLMRSYEQVEMEETRALSSQLPHNQEVPDRRAISFMRRGHFSSILNDDPANFNFMDESNQTFEEGRRRRRETYDSVFYIREIINGCLKENFIHRPNRTTRAWLIERNFVLVFLLLICTFSITTHLFLFYLAGCVSVTNFGFELVYHNCADWIVRQPSEVWPKYEHIYRANNSNFDYTIRKAEQARLPLHDLRPLNWYNILRTSLDMADNAIFWIDSSLVLGANLLIISLGAIDLLIYSEAIQAKLKRTIKRAKLSSLSTNQSIAMTRNQIPPPTRMVEDSIESRIFLKTNAIIQADSGVNSLPIGKVANSGPSDIVQEDILEIQTSLVDYFTFLGKYNPHSASYAFFWVGCWISYSIIVCGYAFSAKNPFDIIDYYWTELFLSGSAVALIIPVALVKSSSTKLYQLISASMAVDEGVLQTKARWIIILEYYFPVPLSCYTVFKSTELSLLYILKVS